MSEINGHINGAAVGSEPEFDEFPLHVFTLQDVKDGKTPCTITDVESLLIGQAQTHKTRYTGDGRTLVRKLSRENSALKGIVLFSVQHGAVALATLFTGFHKDGQRKFYAEDLFVASDFRSHGVFRILLHEVAKYTTQNGGHHLQWETMSNNAKMQQVINHYGAIKPDVVTLDATSFLAANYSPPPNLQDAWNNHAIVTSMITSQHESDLRKLAISPQIIWARGDLPFSGFITHDNSQGGKPIAVTAAWPRIGTFDLTDGIVLEHPLKEQIPGESDADNLERTRLIVASTIRTLRETAERFEKRAAHKIHTAKWLVNKGKSGPTSAYEVLANDFGIVTETLGGGDREEWVLRNGKLLERADAGIQPVMRIPRDKQVGQPLAASDERDTRGRSRLLTETDRPPARSKTGAAPKSALGS